MSASNNYNGVTCLLSAVILICALSLEVQVCHSFSSNNVQSPPSYYTQRQHVTQKFQLQLQKNDEYDRPDAMQQQCQGSRRSFLQNCGALVFGTSALTQLPEVSAAKADCMSDCLKECKLIAPKVRRGILMIMKIIIICYKCKNYDLLCTFSG